MRLASLWRTGDPEVSLQLMLDSLRSRKVWGLSE